MSGLIDVIEQLLEADQVSANKKNLTTDGKTADDKTVKPKSGTESGDAKAVGVGKNMDSGPGGQNKAMGGNDVGGKQKGEFKSDAKDNSGEVGPGKSGVMSPVTNNSGMDDKGPNKKGKSGPATSETKGFPSDASPKNQASQPVQNQSKDDWDKGLKEEEELEEKKSKKSEEVGDPDTTPMGDPEAKKAAKDKEDGEAPVKGDGEDDVTDDGEGMDPVGDGDADVDNDGDEDESDEVIMKKRDAIDKADGEDDPDIGEDTEIDEKCGKVHEDDDEDDDMDDMKESKKKMKEMDDMDSDDDDDDDMIDEELEKCYETDFEFYEGTDWDELTEEQIEELFGRSKTHRFAGSKGIHQGKAASSNWHDRMKSMNKTRQDSRAKLGKGKYSNISDDVNEDAVDEEHKLPHGKPGTKQKTDSIPKEKMPSKESGSANEKHRPDVEKGDNMPKDKMDLTPATQGDKSHDQGGDKMETPLKADKVSNTKGEPGKGSAPDESGTDKGPTDQSKQAKEPTGGAKVRKIGEEAEEVDLDEEFKTKAAIVFETAVNEKVTDLREELQRDYDDKLAEELEAVNEKVSEYVDYAVQEWLKENALEIKYSLRTEIAENFIKGLKGLFEENYVEIPEEEFSVVDELTETVESYKEQLEEQNTALEEAQQELLAMKRDAIVEEVAEDLTETQKIRLEKLSESVEATDIEEFQFKVEALKESYFDPSSEDSALLSSLSEEVIDGMGDSIVEETDPVNQYAAFLSRTTLK